MFCLQRFACRCVSNVCKLSIKKGNGNKTVVSSRLFAIRESSNTVDCVTVELGNVFKRYRIEDCPEFSVKLTRKEAKCYYRQMQIIRNVERVAAALYSAKIIRGFCHLYSGQEACCVGQAAAMYEFDCVITAYRCHGWALQFDITPHQLLAELTGRSTGTTRGKGGSMHIYSANFYGGNGIVGAQVPLGTGVALALKYLKKEGVCLTLYGDGAANQGQVFESYNMACLWKLPCVFICENNKYGMGTSDKRSSCNVEYYTRGDLLPGIYVDGMNILAVRSATTFARNYALNCGPIVMELDTYRYFGHSMSDPGVSYRNRDEIQDVRKARDPIIMFRDLILEKCLVTEEEIKCIDDEVKADINKAADLAKTDKEVGMDDLAGDVYFENLEPIIRNIYTYDINHKNIATRLQYKPCATSKDDVCEPEPKKPTEKSSKKGAKADPKSSAKPPAKADSNAAAKNPLAKADANAAARTPPAKADGKPAAKVPPKPTSVPSNKPPKPSAAAPPTAPASKGPKK